MRTGPDLIRATKPFAEEHLPTTWRLFGTSALVALVAAAAAALGPHLVVRAAGSIVLGGMIVRFFIFFHDGLHRAIFKKSKLGQALLYVFGLVILTPPKVWRDSHNYHHRHTSKLAGSSIGSFPLTTVKMYRAMGAGQRFAYRATRHPLNILFAYVTIFGFGMCVANTIRQPKKYWDAPLSLVVHAALLAGLTYVGGFELTLFVVVLPMTIACAAGAYLFYSQHTFPGMELRPRETWEYTAAALHASSMTRMPRLMHWFTGNIGYHHVHHLNAAIPFYRLPEAARSIPELANPVETSLAPKEILACLRIHLWDEARSEMVGFDAARQPSSEGHTSAA